MESPWVAGLFALFIWWFSTGAILWLVRRADNRGGDNHLITAAMTAPLVVLGVAGLFESLNDPSHEGVYVGFLSALAIWGWIEIAFLTGVVTGPNLRPCPPGTPERERFLCALGAIAWHEALLVCALGAIAVVSIGAENAFALWTFLVLFCARVSAKLNLFLGVPYINIDFLPEPLAHLASHFRRGPLNRLFPASVTLLSLAAACWLERLNAAADPGAVVGFALLTTLTLLALLEHWFMALPLADERLWRWMMPARKSAAPRPPQGERN
jgi:putative photosynthetic complex assembly protein 2